MGMKGRERKEKGKEKAKRNRQKNGDNRKENIGGRYRETEKETQIREKDR